MAAAGWLAAMTATAANHMRKRLPIFLVALSRLPPPITDSIAPQETTRTFSHT
jgi:hypothetical protein